MKLGQFIDNLHDENKKIEVYDIDMNILSVYDGRNSIDERLNNIDILKIIFTDRSIELRLNCTEDDVEVNDEKMALRGYYTLDTIRERLNEGSLNLNDIWKNDCEILDYLCEALRDRDYISACLARYYVSKYDKRLANLINWDDEYKLTKSDFEWKYFIDENVRKEIAIDYLKEHF